jgi:cell division protein FtsX
MLLVVAAVFCMLAFLGGTWSLVVRLPAALSPVASQNVHLIAYLEDSLPASGRDRLVQGLRRSQGVATVRFIDREEARARLLAAAARLGPEQPALTTLEPSFLPHSIEIAVTPGSRIEERAAQLAARVRTLAGVAEVDGMAQGFGRLAAWAALGKWVLGAAFGIGCLVALVVLAAAVSTARSRRRAQVEVLSLLGEGPEAIRLPGSLTVLGAAVAGAGAGMGLLALGWPVLLRLFESQMGLVPQAVPTLVLRDATTALIGAVLAGGLAGWFSTPRPHMAHG